MVQYVLEPQVDERHHIYDNLTFVGRASSLPTKFKLDAPKSRDQLDSWDCVAFAFTNMLNSDTKVRYGKDVLFSVKFLKKFCKDVDGIPLNQGTLMSAACKVLAQKGCCEDYLYPWQNNGDKFEIITNEMLTNASQYKIKSYSQISTVDKIKEAVYYENGVCMAMNIYASFDDDKHGHIPKPQGKKESRHAMNIIGWDDNYTFGGFKGYFVVLDNYPKQASYGVRYLPYDLIQGYFNCEFWTTYDSDKVQNKNWHIDKFNGEAIVLYNDTIKMKVDSKVAIVNGVEKTMPLSAKVVEGSTYIPLRFVGECFRNSYVVYTSQTKTIEVVDQDCKKNYFFKIGDCKVKTSSGEVIYTMLKPPIIDNGSTLIPIRAVSEVMGAKVDFDSKTKEIKIVR